MDDPCSHRWKRNIDIRDKYGPRLDLEQSNEQETILLKKSGTMCALFDSVDVLFSFAAFVENSKRASEE